MRRAELMLLATTLLWGATFAIGKHLVDAGIEPVAVVAWRFAIAAVLFVLLFGRRVVLRPSNRVLTHGAILGLLLYAGFALQTYGLRHTSSSRSGFITTLYVIFTPLLQVFVTRRALSRNVVAGIVLVLLGLWALTAPGGEVAGLVDPWSSGGFNRGDVMTLGCAVVYAFYMILMDRYTADGAQIATLTFLQLATVAVASGAHLALMAALGALDGSAMPPPSLELWGWILYLAFFASVLSTYLQTHYQRETTPSRAAIIFTLESVFAAIIGAVALGEQFTTLSLAGGALIVGGLLAVELRQTPTRGSAAEAPDVDRALEAEAEAEAEAVMHRH